MLVVGTGAGAREAAERLRAAGYAVVAVPDAPAAREALAAGAAPLVLLDLTEPLLDRAALAAALTPEGPPVPDTLDDAERRHIARMLAHTHGNRREAARLLGIARSTLLHKLRRYGLDRAR